MKDSWRDQVAGFSSHASHGNDRRSLEEEVEASLRAHDVGAVQSTIVRLCMGLLAIKDRNTYNHSVRVGQLSSRIALRFGLDPKVALVAGFLHDVGKLLVPPEILHKQERYGEADHAEMRHHAEYSRRLLEGMFEYVDVIVSLHHWFQKNGYPERIPRAYFAYNPQDRLLIRQYALYLSLADFYDAARTRRNDRNEHNGSATGRQVHAQMVAEHQRYRPIINELYAKKIFKDGD
jgi:putative two-component system response regulator